MRGLIDRLYAWWRAAWRRHVVDDFYGENVHGDMP